MNVLCINAGSSSLKWTMYDSDGETVASATVATTEPAPAVRSVLDQLADRSLAEPQAVGHRIVHGGPAHTRHTVIDDGVLADLREAVPFAPLHLPPALAAIEATRERFGVPEVACFDTAFHRDLPDVAKRFALPDWVHEAGVHRYGFHGLSCEYVVERLGADGLGRAVIAHLGSGASLTAVRHGCSVDTTMGLTPTGGVVMATRSGDLDPGVLIHLAREHDLGPDQLEELVDRQGGLQGLAGSHDMEALVRDRATDPMAGRAVEAFCYRARQAVGALAASLGGIDSLVFTGGIGEHSPVVRSTIADGLEHLGVVLDASANERGDARIDASTVAVHVVATDENLMIARHTTRLLS